ncbi:Cathepsin L1, partial [Calypte anna]
QPGAMTLLGLLLALLGCTMALDPALEEVWERWKSLHSKEYPEEVEAIRREVWEKNLRRIHQHNQEESQGQHSFRLAMNHHGDLVHEEFNQLLNGCIPAWQEKPKLLFQESGALKTPAEVDWRAKGSVTPVKDQVSTEQEVCGGFVMERATGALEGQVFKRTGKLVVLSEQNLIDCSRKLGNHGCQGGYMTLAFQYVRDNGGLNSEHVYPYVATVRDSSDPGDTAERWPVGSQCHHHLLPSFRTPLAADTTPRTRQPKKPWSVAGNASSFHFHFYKSGIFSSVLCSQRVNHGMLAVGYGVSQEQGHNISYWILKNSWSEVWGEQGYIRLLKGSNNQCGVANQASFPL